MQPLNPALLSPKSYPTPSPSPALVMTVFVRGHTLETSLNVSHVCTEQMTHFPEKYTIQITIEIQFSSDLVKVMKYALY